MRSRLGSSRTRRAVGPSWCACISCMHIYKSYNYTFSCITYTTHIYIHMETTHIYIHTYMNQVDNSASLLHHVNKLVLGGEGVFCSYIRPHLYKTPCKASRLASHCLPFAGYFVLAAQPLVACTLWPYQGIGAELNTLHAGGLSVSGLIATACSVTILHS